MALNAGGEAGPARRPWSDLLLYGGVFMVFAAASALPALLRVSPPAVGLLILALSSIVVLGGGTLLVARLRGAFRPGDIGLWPARVDFAWLGAAVGTVFVLLPVRIALGLAASYLVEGGLDSVTRRGNLIAGVQFSWPAALVSVIGVGLLAPVGEELLFRAGIFGWLRSRMSLAPAALTSSCLFALAHIDSVGVAASSFVLGLVCAWAFARSRTIWTSIAVHACNNAVAVVLLQAALALGGAAAIAPSR